MASRVIFEAFMIRSNGCYSSEYSAVYGCVCVVISLIIVNFGWIVRVFLSLPLDSGC